MIVDFVQSRYEGLYLYERTRGPDGVLKENYIYSDDSAFVKPFFWIRQNAPSFILKKLKRFKAVIHSNIVATALDGGKLWKVTYDNPFDSWNMKDAIDPKGKWTCEMDTPYLDQVLLERYPNGIPEFHPRKWYYDMEWETDGEGRITVIAVCDTHAEKNVVFAWSQDSYDNRITKKEWIDRYDGYELRTFASEEYMLSNFVAHLIECDPDMLIAHAGAWADLPKLHDRLGERTKDISPLNIFLPPKKNGEGYKSTAQPIKGRLVYDTAAMATEGSGFEGVWQKSGRGQAQQRKLNWFATALGLGHKLTDEIEGMTVFNGWAEYYDDFVDYCLVDTTLLRDIDMKLNCTDFHLALQNVAGVQFASTHNVSRYFRGLVGRRTELKAPTTRQEERPELQAAWVMPPVAGRHEAVALVDFASLYPNIILSANLCWTTMVEEAGEDVISFTIPPKLDDAGNHIAGTGGTFHWNQKQEGILPKVVRELLQLRKHYKKLMKESTDADEKLGYNMLQMAVKVSVNAIYGMVGMGKLQGGWTSYPIAQSITYLGRESISMLVDKSEEMGYRGLAGHTDSCYIQVPFDEAIPVAEELTRIAQEEMGLKYLDVELEAFFDYWFTANTKNRNFGIKTWPPEDAGDMKVTGFSIKASSAPAVTKELIGEAFRMIGSGADEEEVHAHLRPSIKELFSGEKSADYAASFGRIKKQLHEYDKVVPNPAKAARYSNRYLGTNYDKGESIKWVFIDDVPEDQEYCNVIAYDDESQLEGYGVDWSTIVDKWIHSKLKRVYETLEWDLNSLTARRIPKRWW